MMNDETMLQTMVTFLSWGKMEVSIDGERHTFKDCKVWPGGAREWRWEETDTHHDPGVQPADIEELLKQEIDVIVLGRGQLGRLKISAEIEALLSAQEIPYHFEKTQRAVQLFNELARQGKRVGGLFHSTC